MWDDSTTPDGFYERYVELLSELPDGAEVLMAGLGNGRIPAALPWLRFDVVEIDRKLTTDLSNVREVIYANWMEPKYWPTSRYDAIVVDIYDGHAPAALVGNQGFFRYAERLKPGGRVLSWTEHGGQFWIVSTEFTEV